MTAIAQVCQEKRIPQEVVIEAVEAALISAYKRNFGTTQNIAVRIDPSSGEARVYAQKQVVAEVQDARTEISLEEATRYDSTVQEGETVEIEMTPRDFGRIAAQTAKQVVMQKLREAEREAVMTEFANKEGDIDVGIVQRTDPARGVILEIGKVETVLAPSEQIPNESYKPGQHLQVYILEVRRSNRGPQIIVSRSHRNLLRRLFEREIPEIYNGTVEIKGIAREPGSRAKVAVAARQEGIDPVGSCVGQRGNRIQAIVNELNGERIDVVPWSSDITTYIANALSPAQVEKVELDPEDKTAYVVVADRQLSLAIGKEGQNARLAAKLTGWRVDIRSASVAAREPTSRRKKPIFATGEEEESLFKLRMAEALEEMQSRASQNAAMTAALADAIAAELLAQEQGATPPAEGDLPKRP